MAAAATCRRRCRWAALGRRRPAPCAEVPFAAAGVTSAAIHNETLLRSRHKQPRQGASVSSCQYGALRAARCLPGHQRCRSVC